MITIHHYLALATLMFICGLLGVLFRKNILFILMSIQLMLNAANLMFVSASHYLQNLDGKIMAFFIVAVATCQAIVGLAMVITIFRKYNTVDSHFFKLLRG